MAHDAQVVGDEQVGQAEVVLQVVEQVDDLGLDRDVESRDRLVEDDQLRLEREGAGDADPLALTARELVREAVDVLRREPDGVEQLAHAPVDLRLLHPAEKAAGVVVFRMIARLDVAHDTDLQ